MKKSIIRSTTKLFLALFNKKVISNKSGIWRSIVCVNDNILSLNEAWVSHSKIFLNGKNIKVEVKGSMYKSAIRIDGDNNSVILSSKTILNNSQIIVRGTGCTFFLGEASTVGGANFVCMGKDNSIFIGKECMFSDKIEIWNTDSHPIYDETGHIINKSLPIQIGNHVWLCKGVTVLKGTSIGDGSVVGMNSTVLKNIYPHTLNAGSPSRELRKNIQWGRSFIPV